jgi:hypothetical protein
MTSPTYPSLDAFYAADARRRRSRERDIGLAWRARAGSSFRAAWVQETGEVYLCKHGEPDRGGGIVLVLPRRFEEEPAFDGYRRVCGRPGSLAWLLQVAS